MKYRSITTSPSETMRQKAKKFYVLEIGSIYYVFSINDPSRKHCRTFLKLFNFLYVSSSFRTAIMAVHNFLSFSLISNIWLLHYHPSCSCSAISLHILGCIKRGYLLLRKEERNTKMVTTHEIVVSSAQLDLDYTVINHQTVWKDWIETMGMYFMALNIR